MEIYLAGEHADKCALVDADAPALVFKANWSLTTNGYAKTNIPMGDGRFTTVMMHRVVMGAGKGQMIDHINRNKLDNRRENLRFATSSENARNKSFKNSLKYRGVSVSGNRAKAATTSYPRYVASIMVEGRTQYLGTYLTQEAAGLAYNDAARAADGEYAVLNDIDESFRQPPTKVLREMGHFTVPGGNHRNKLGLWGVQEYRPGRFSARYRGKTLGTFDTAEEAARVYDKEARANGYYRVNFPE